MYRSKPARDELNETRGRAGGLQKIASELRGVKGVLRGQLVLARTIPES